MHERLKMIRSSMKLNQADFAKSLGIGLSTLGMMEVGKRNILDRHIKTICSIYDVNEDWLRTGEGEMFVQPKTFTLDEKAEQYNLTDLEIEIMKNYMELDPHVRKSILNMFKKSFSNLASEDRDGKINIEKEVESYRHELEASQKVQKSFQSDITGDSETS